MTQLTALVAMRLTHDLAGPIGAISTGVGMLEGGDPDIHELIADSSAAAVASLRLHRFVLAPPEGDAADARALLTAWIATRDEVTLDWRVTSSSPRHVATLMGLAMCAVEASPRGGRLSVADDGVMLETRSVMLDPGVEAALEGGPVTVSRAALGGLMAAAAADLGATLAVEKSDAGIRLGYQGNALPR